MNYSFRLFQAFSHDRKNYPFCQERKKGFSYRQSWQGARQPLEQCAGIRMPEGDIALQEHSLLGPDSPEPSLATEEPALLLASSPTQVHKVKAEGPHSRALQREGATGGPPG